MRLLFLTLFFSNFATAYPTKEECWASYVRMAPDVRIILPGESTAPQKAVSLQNDAKQQRILELAETDELIWASNKPGLSERHLATLIDKLPPDQRVDLAEFRSEVTKQNYFESAELYREMGDDRMRKAEVFRATQPHRATTERNIALIQFRLEQATLHKVRNELAGDELFLNNARKVAILRGVHAKEGDIQIEGDSNTYRGLAYNPNRRKGPADTLLVYVPTLLNERDAAAATSPGSFNGRPRNLILVSPQFTQFLRLGIDEKHEFRHVRWKRLNLQGTPSVFSGHATAVTSPLPFLKSSKHLEDSHYVHDQSDEEAPNLALGLRDYIPILRNAKGRFDLKGMMNTVKNIRYDARTGQSNAIRSQAIARVLERDAVPKNIVKYNRTANSETPEITIDDRLHLSFPNRPRHWKQGIALQTLGRNGNTWFDYTLPLRDFDTILALRRPNIENNKQRIAELLQALSKRFRIKDKVYAQFGPPLKHIESLARAYIKHPTIQNYEALEIALRDMKVPRVRTWVSE